RHRLDFLEVIQIDRVLSRTISDEAQNTSHVRLAILGSSTTDHLAPAIRVAGLRRDLLIEVYIAPFGQYRQQLLGPDSALVESKPDYILLSLAAREAIANVELTATKADVDAALCQYVSELRVLWRKAKEDLRATVIQQTFLNTEESLFGSYDRLVPT